MIEPSAVAFIAVSKRLDGTLLTPPLLFVLFGFAASTSGLNLIDVNFGHSAIHLIAEFTLILILFGDAARIDLKCVRQYHDLPLRMLLFGLPLIILCGTLASVLLFPAFGFWEAALLAALLAPTDAALGQAVVSAGIVPVRIRQAINIESGLNDGVALPAVLLFAALTGAHGDGAHATDWLWFAMLQLTLGPLIGALFGYLAGRLLDTAATRGWADNSGEGIGVLALATMTYLVAEMAGGNGFIAVFVGGMVFGNTIRRPCTFIFEFMETEGRLLMLITFFIFGAALLPQGIADVQPAFVLYAVLSLTIIRMAPIAISLIHAGVRVSIQLFLGWFGPRGLASILFVLLILEEADLPHGQELLSITVITVALSTLLHGVSAAPLASRYGRLTERMGHCPENEDVVALPTREGHIP